VVVEKLEAYYDCITAPSDSTPNEPVKRTFFPEPNGEGPSLIIRSMLDTAQVFKRSIMAINGGILGSTALLEALLNALPSRPVSAQESGLSFGCMGISGGPVDPWAVAMALLKAREGFEIENLNPDISGFDEIKALAEQRFGFICVVFGTLAFLKQPEPGSVRTAPIIPDLDYDQQTPRRARKRRSISNLTTRIKLRPRKSSESLKSRAGAEVDPDAPPVPTFPTPTEPRSSAESLPASQTQPLGRPSVSRLPEGLRALRHQDRSLTDIKRASAESASEEPSPRLPTLTSGLPFTMPVNEATSSASPPESSEQSSAQSPSPPKRHRFSRLRKPKSLISLRSRREASAEPTQPVPALSSQLKEPTLEPDQTPQRSLETSTQVQTSLSEAAKARLENTEETKEASP
jgi:hypothetical protein